MLFQSSIKLSIALAVAMGIASGDLLAQNNQWHSIQPGGEPLQTVTRMKPVLQTETIISPSDRSAGTTKIESRNVRVVGYERGESYLAPISVTQSIPPNRWNANNSSNTSTVNYNPSNNSPNNNVVHAVAMQELQDPAGSRPQLGQYVPPRVESTRVISSTPIQVTPINTAPVVQRWPVVPASRVVASSPVTLPPPVVQVPTRYNTTYRPVIPLASLPQNNYSVGQGMLGQPKLYMDNQPVRNFFRYLLP